MGSLEKWVDELMTAIEDLEKRVDSINITPAPEPLTEYALIDQVDGIYKIVNPMQYKEDGITAFVSDSTGEYLRLKSGAGVFVSEARSINAVDLTDLDVIKLKYTAIGETRDAELDISTYTGQWYIGAYYEATASYFEVGVTLYSINTPQIIAAKIAAIHNAAASGNVHVYGYAAEKTPETNTRKKTTKKK